MKNTHKVVSVFLNKDIVGRLSILPNKISVFEYDNNFIKGGVSISPFYLPLKPGVFAAKQKPFNGLFGVFNDSLPDGWGTLLTNRMLQEKSYELSNITILDRLCLVGENGIGALSYHPEWDINKDVAISNYNEIARKVEQILLHENYENISELYKMGGSSGGARPKIFTKNDNQDWIIKFKSSIDPEYIGKMEYDYSISAKKCSIEMSETKLFEGKYFGTRRFDIEGNIKYHIHSAAGLLYASHRLPSLDYLELMKATYALTNDINEMYKLFRLMVFNVLTENKDDHSKNFSFMYKNNKWQLSPAYDLVKSFGFNAQHTTTILGKGNPCRNDIFELAKKINLKLNKTNNIYDEVFEETKDLRKKYLQ